jgi:hypothetical protein
VDPISALVLQMDALRQKLVETEKAVQSPKLDSWLRKRVEARFDTLLNRRRTRLQKLRESVSSLSRGQPLQPFWQEFSQCERECRELFEECLAFVQGALVRAAGIDNSACLMADNLLDDLAFWADVGWDRFTLLDTGEFYGETAEIVRVRFPDVSLWSLPLAAHEFGHFLGPELKESQAGGSNYPFQGMLRDADANRPSGWTLAHTKDWQHLHERFADLFATYTLGPAFASSFILSRLNPGEAYVESSTHPSHAKRVHAILWVLSKMDQEAGGLGRPYGALIDLLRNFWRESLQAAGQPDGLPAPEAALLEQRLDELYNLLKRTTSAKLAYQSDNWRRAEDLASILLPDKPWHPSAKYNEATLRDVLNAAWLSRLEQREQEPYLVNEISRRALDLYRLVPAVKPGYGGA